MGKGTLEYKDVNGLTTKIIWNKNLIADDYLNDYIDRIIDDKGIVESADCFVDSLSDLSGIEEREFCGSDDPLSIKWAGKRYSSTAPSSATIRVLIKDLADRAFLEDIFDDGYSVNITKEINGTQTQFWKGVLTPQLSIEEYKQFPYILALNANDKLASSKDRQFLMVDFPNPWPNNIISVLQIIVKYINLELYPNKSFILNVADRIRVNVDWGLDDIYLDPLVFMEDDKDEYIPFKDVLDNLLKPLNLQLLQWKSQWWLLSLDAQWDGGKITYTEYSILKSDITDNGSKEYDIGILDLYKGSPVDRGVNDLEVKAASQLNFIPPWKKVEINQDFQENTCILPLFANRTGSFYVGHIPEGETDIQYLEFGEVGSQETPLNHWTYNEDMFTDIRNLNDGYLTIRSRLNSGEYDDNISQYSIVSEVDNTFDRIIIKLNYEKQTIQYSSDDISEHLMKKWTIGYEWLDESGGDRWLIDQITGDNLEWATSSTPQSVDTYDDTDYIISTPNKPFGFEGRIKLSFMLYKPFGDLNLHKWPVINLVFKLSNDFWTQLDFKDQIDIGINPNTDEIVKETYLWGLSLLNQASTHIYHISSIYTDSGTPIEYFIQDGSPTGHTFRQLLDWKAQTYINENSEYTSKLTGEYKSNNISPLQLISDYEGRIYKFTNGTWNDKMGTWKVEFTEAKFVKNIPTNPSKCDFSPYDFNNDFCTEFLTSIGKDYYERVTNDGGTIDDLYCFNLAILELSS